jgi:hypothetical protein
MFVMFMARMRPPINMRNSRDILKQGVWVCHKARRGWDSQFCWGFLFHEPATATVFYNSKDIKL